MQVGDTFIGPSLPPQRKGAEKHKVSPEELEARKNNFFMKIWNPLSGLVITIWKYLLRILNIIWGYIKKAGIFLKNRYVELKNKREKNK